MPDSETLTHAETLARARLAGTIVPPLEVGDEAEAYRLQAAAVAALGQALAGLKIGATAAAAQAAFGISGPFWGPMPEPDVHASGASLPARPGRRGVECEIAFRLARDLAKRERPYTREEVEAAVGSVHLAIEVIGLRMAADGPLSGFQTIADFAGNAAFVHGPAIADWRTRDLATIEAACLVNGTERARGKASVVMGSPLVALRWLADRGPGLKAGQWVSTGTLTGLTPIAAGDRVKGVFTGLGEVEVSFRAA
jgi:2-keto-4-pentenoate hydratase